MAKDVIENGPFELAEDFASIWDMKNSDGNSNKEVIWYVDYSTNQLYNSELDDKPVIRNGGNNAHLLFCSRPTGRIDSGSRSQCKFGCKG